jgi:hypothetical protein
VDISLTELRLAVGVTEAELAEAAKVLRFSDDLKIAFTTADRITLGASWRGRCEDQGLGPA